MSQGLTRIHHVEMVVGNAKQSAFFYRKAFGFDQVAYKGPETGCPDTVHYVMRQNDIWLILTTPLRHDDPLNTWLTMHGDGVRDIAFEVADLDAVYGHAVKSGAPSWSEPCEEKDDSGAIRTACIRTYGEVLHTFIDRQGYPGFLPGYEIREIKGINTGLQCIAHILGNV